MQYIREDQKCEQPGIYAFDASKLAWQSSFNAADHPDDENADNTVLAGSYGYQVPEPVQSVIGGSSNGGATATQPASGPATDGPFKTGVPPVFTVTGTGSTATVMNPGGGPNSPGGSNGPSGGTIAAGVIAALAGLLALYLGFCAWLWRRQVRAYKKHMVIANRYGEDDFKYDGIAAGAAGAVGEKLRKKGQNSARPSGNGGGTADEDRIHFSWVGQLHEPSPGSGSARHGSLAQSHSDEDRNLWGFGYDNYPESGARISASAAEGGGVNRSKSNGTWSTRSGNSAEALLDGREPNFFSVVLGPRRALRVVNGMEES